MAPGSSPDPRESSAPPRSGLASRLPPPAWLTHPPPSPPPELEARIRASLGRALHVTGNNDGAVGEFVRAVELQPQDWRYDANLGIFYAELGAWLNPPRGLEYATACFDRAIANAPEGRKSGLRAQRGAVLAAASTPEL